MSVFVSAYTLVAISTDRYSAIIFPLHPRMTRSTAKIIIVAVWTVAIATAIPVGVTSTLVEPSPWHHLCQRQLCREKLENLA